MPLFRPSELRQRLLSLDKKANKALGQNFLIDGNIISNLVKAANVGDKDFILEIGPGPGALSEAILSTGASLLAIEKDRSFANSLQEIATLKEKLTVIADDALKVPIEQTIKQLLPKNQKAKLVSSLPYNVGTAIIIKLLPLNTTFSSLTVIMQEEVARRFVASPNTKDYGSLSVFTRFYSNPKYEFKITANCFYPKPKVTSAAVTFHLKKPYSISSHSQFFELVKTAFNQKRKMMRASLKKKYSIERILQALKQTNLSEKTRPEDLSLDQFIAFFEAMEKSL